jgi:two-component sensor histidine kinase
MVRGITNGEQRSADELVRESNHRIANHLTLLNATIQLQINTLMRGPEQISRQTAIDHLRTAVSRIVSIGNLHRRLAGSTDSLIELGQFLSEARSELLASLASGERAHVEEQMSKGCAVTPEQASVVSLVMGEMIVNSLKYAHPVESPVFIRLACKSMESAVVVEIADDGVGLPQDFDEARDSGVGFRLMRSLLRKIGAELAYKSGSDGLQYRITVPEAISG